MGSIYSGSSRKGPTEAELRGVGVREIRGALRRGHGGHRRQHVQGGQQSRQNFTERKLQARMQQLDESVQRYLTELDRADRDASLVTEARVEHLKDKLARVKEQMGALRQIEQQLNEAPDQQVSLTDPDARSMATSGRGTGIVGYNVQAAVDTLPHRRRRPRSPDIPLRHSPECRRSTYHHHELGCDVL